jgi:hypothetical protein
MSMHGGRKTLAPVTPDWLTIREAQERLEAMHGVEISYVAVQKACLRYRHRIEGRTLDDQPVDPEAAKREDSAPLPRELRCIWKSMGGGPAGRFGRRLIYLVDPDEENLAHLEMRGFDSAEPGPGRRVGGPFSHKSDRTYGGRPASTSQPVRKPAKKTSKRPAAGAAKAAGRRPAGAHAG